MEGVRDLENVLWVDHDGGIADHLGDRRGVAGHDRSAVRHGLQWRQPEAFVERWEYEDLGEIVENAQYANRDEAEEANVVLHPALNHGAAQVGMLGKLIADDDELQVGVLAVLFQVALKSGEGFNDADHVLVRADASGVEQEWIVDLVALGNELAVGVGGVSLAETVIEGVVDDFDLVTRDVEQALGVILGEI